MASADLTERTGVDHTLPPPPPKPRRRRSTLLSLVVGVLVAAALLASGLPQQALARWLITQPDTYRASPYYMQVIEQYGQPERWWLADGPRQAGADPIRVEQWFYPEQGVWIWFVDGLRGTEQYFTPDPALLEVSSPVSPTALHRGMSQDEVEGVLGAAGQRVGPVRTAIGRSQTWAYPEVSLVVQYLDGRFLTAQTM